MKDLVAIRHHLHQNPELSKEETNTQQYIYDLLGKLKLDLLEKVANTGILVQIKGKAEGKNILFRGDMDALPIEETNDMPYRSKNKGVSHKCGHDGHTTIMYGLAKHFSEHPPEKGNVNIIFQPAEEIGWGANAVEESKCLDDLDIDMVFALHNIPGLPLQQITCKEKSFTPSVTTLIAYFKGYTAHAAEPWNGRNPAMAISKYIQKALGYNEEKSANEFVTITPAYMKLGEIAYGTSAGEGSVHLTIRANSNEKLDSVINNIKSDAEAIAKEEELDVDFEFEESFESNQNAQEAVAIIRNAAEEVGLNYKEKDAPFRWGEDFGLFTNRYKGAMFGMGSGETCKPLHHPAYDFPDDIIDNAIKMFATIHEKAQ